MRQSASGELYQGQGAVGGPGLSWAELLGLLTQLQEGPGKDLGSREQTSRKPTQSAPNDMKTHQIGISLGSVLRTWREKEGRRECQGPAGKGQGTL